LTNSFIRFFTPKKLRSFYMSDLYPAVISLLVAFGAIFGIEIYTAALHTIIAVIGLCISNSIKPTLISLLTFVMQLSVKNSPFYPNRSDYLYTGWRLFVVLAIFIAVIIGFSAFIYRNRVYKRTFLAFGKGRGYFALLFAALLLNGAFYDKWTLSSLLFGILNAALLCVFPVLLYNGFSEKENSDDIAGYFSYLSLLVGLVITAELFALYMTNDKIFAEGSINKVEVALGFGIWNLVGNSLIVLIPLIFYGIAKGKHPVLYFCVACAVYIASVFTMSRNALLVGTALYFICILIYCFYGRYQKFFRFFALFIILLALVFFATFYGEIKKLLADYFNRGLSDNGRFKLWGIAFKNFLSSPLFGCGFFGLDVDDSVLYSFGPVPKMAHNTLVQLLSSSGLFGLFSYLLYRFFTLKEIFTRLSLKKTFMALSMAALIAGSLVDNFIFNIYPLFSYTVSLVIIAKENEERAKKL